MLRFCVPEGGKLEPFAGGFNKLGDIRRQLGAKCEGEEFEGNFGVKKELQWIGLGCATPGTFLIL